MAPEIMRRSLRIFEACERLRARRNPGTAMEASSAMIATTIMISTSVKPRRLWLDSIFIGWLVVRCGKGAEGRPLSHDQPQSFAVANSTTPLPFATTRAVGDG